MFDYDNLDILRDISPKDEMFSADYEGYIESYLGVGKSGLQSIELVLKAANKSPADITRILDLPCGHGRILRVLRAAFPTAKITVCDINEDGVAFCAKTFDAVPVIASEHPSPAMFDETFDLIWVGSLFTHLDINQLYS